ncbi:MAG TPA: universal stress protein [Candidatus Polarisedimenticolia bacterium]|nr:universal stress protein [Candidatus Polarisedimenticolia bacterium]
MKILLAVDGSECSTAAAAEVARRPWPDGSEVKVVSVAEPPSMMALPDTWGPPTDYWDKLEQSAQKQAEDAAGKAVGVIRAGAGKMVRVVSELLRGLPKEEILREAEGWDADLIVVGSHGYRGLRRLWLGSVSHAVALGARCSVEIVRCPETERKD